MIEVRVSLVDENGADERPGYAGPARTYQLSIQGFPAGHAHRRGVWPELSDYMVACGFPQCWVTLDAPVRNVRSRTLTVRGFPVQSSSDLPAIITRFLSTLPPGNADA